MVSIVGFVLKRLSRLVLTVFIMTSIVFFLVRVLPGDPAAVIAGLDAEADQISVIRTELGLDQPVVVQYLRWLWEMLRFDFGNSLFDNQPAMQEILRRFPVTMSVAVMAFALSLLIAIPVGVMSAVRRWTILDYAGMVYSQVGMAIPSFWLAILLLLFFAVRLRWFPLFGAGSLLHLVLPAVALAIGRSAILVRYVRSSMIEQLEREYVVTAESLGLPVGSIRYRHALKNALLPVITVAGIQFGGMIGGTIIIEQVFSLPGIGRLLLSAIQIRDFPVIQGGVIFIAVVFSLVNFLADVLYGVVNPRVRVAS